MALENSSDERNKQVSAFTGRINNYTNVDLWNDEHSHDLIELEPSGCISPWESIYGAGDLEFQACGHGDMRNRTLSDAVEPGLTSILPILVIFAGGWMAEWIRHRQILAVN